jgi:hypothetical protein
LAFTLRTYTTSLDRDFLAWVTPIIEADPQAPVSVIDAVRHTSRLDDASLRAYQERSRRPGHAVTLSNFVLNVVAAHMERLTILPATVQDILLNIKAQIDFINNDVEIARELFLRTFDLAMAEGMRETLVSNLDVTYKQIASRAEEAVKNIGDVLVRL